MRLKGVQTFKKRSDFIYMTRFGRMIRSRSLCVQVAPARVCEDHSLNDNIKIGFTVSKKSGNAVERNKIKRRMRVIAQKVIASRCSSAFRYVLIANRFSYGVGFSRLESDTMFCLRKFFSA